MSRYFIIVLLASLSLFGCIGSPKGVYPVKTFQLPAYLGSWYEIARLDHSFEHGMRSVTATYSMRDDGGVKILNKGFKEDSQEWSEAEGKAYFVDATDVGHLKVSFFGPFYGSYIIFELDTLNYQYAFVSGMNTDYLWLLARTPTVSDELIEHFVESASALGFDTEQLIFVDQSNSH
jgi:apolipoprotein D and lipocalin family protein